MILESNILNWTFLGSILLASLMGSFHCVGMCGGLMLATTQSKSRILYHLGRGISYLLLGALAGLLGEKFYSSGLSLILKHIATGLIFCVLVWTGWQMVRQPGMKSPIGDWIARLSHRLFPWVLRFPAMIRSLLAGLMTGALPCGWLYSFVLLAVASQSNAKGAVIMMAFWLGTLPALMLVGRGEVWFKAHTKPFMHRFMGIVFILLAFVSVTQKTAGHTEKPDGQSTSDAMLLIDLLVPEYSNKTLQSNQFFCHE